MKRHLSPTPKCILTVVLLALLLFCHQSAWAADWVAGTANWNVGANWSPAAVPNGVVANIQNGGTAQFNVALPNANGVNVGVNAGSTGFVEQSGGSLTSTNHFEVGRFGTGTYTQTGGSLTINNGPTRAVLNIGGVSGNGTFNLSGASSTITIANGELYVGETGTGKFNMSGGTINTSSAYEFHVGSGNFSGNFGNGTFNQSGGTVHANTFMHIGRQQSTGVYNLSGASSVLNIVNRLMLGEGNGNGTLNISGGTINLTNTGGIDTLHVGGSGTGTVNQTGGSIVSGSWAHVGRAGGNGVYNLSGGSFSIPTAGKSLFIGESGNGTLNVYGSAATMNVRNFVLQDAGDTLRYTLTNTGTTQITVTDNITHFDGNLDVDLAGGAALLANTSHTLISGTAILNGGDNSIFGEALWNKSNPGGNTVQVSLKPTELKPFNTISKQSGPFAPTNQGWVSLTGLIPGQELDVHLDLQTTAPLNTLLGFLNSNGHDASVSTFGGPFDIMLSFNPTSSTANFAWDFSDFDALNNSTTTVSFITTAPEPASIALWLTFGVVGMAIAARLRRPSVTKPTRSAG